jgi:hypothetical protein
VSAATRGEDIVFVHFRAGIVSLAASAAMLGACGGGIEGTYNGGDNSFLESISFKSGGKVHVTFMGMTKEGSYTIDGDEVTISVNGDTEVLRKDGHGCLVGGGFLGSYCKDNKKPS